jgi:CRP/FNR family transcriptional regulator, dissimilatory nitrate respiration regulator
MINMDILKKIAAMPLFAGLTPKQCESLLAISQEKKFEQGQSFFSEGDEGTGFYMILTGRVKIFKLSMEGKEQILHIVGSEEAFGEVAVFTGEHYPASAQAITDCRTLFFPRLAFVALVNQNPSLALNMLAFLSSRLRKLTQLVENLSLKEVPGRLAAYLLYLSNGKDDSALLALDISKNQLAGLLGTIPETLSRILKRMVKEKYIKTGTRHIQILDHKGLADLASGERRLT